MFKYRNVHCMCFLLTCKIAMTVLTLVGCFYSFTKGPTTLGPSLITAFRGKACAPGQQARISSLISDVFLNTCPWSTKAVVSSAGIFVEIANNTLYGSKLYIFLLCQKSFDIKIMFHEDILYHKYTKN